MARVGDIVLYRNRAGVEMPAIVSQFTDESGRWAHLSVFAPSGQEAERGDHEWGYPHESQIVGTSCGTWYERPTMPTIGDLTQGGGIVGNEPS